MHVWRLGHVPLCATQEESPSRLDRDSKFESCLGWSRARPLRIRRESCGIFQRVVDQVGDSLAQRLFGCSDLLQHRAASGTKEKPQAHYKHIPQAHSTSIFRKHTCAWP